MTNAAVIENEEVVSEEERISDEEMFGERYARDYQIAAKNETVDAIINGEMRILVKQPTGAGKTFTSGLIFSCPKLRKHFGLKEDEKMRILFIAHKHRLLTQAEREYAKAENIELILQSVFTPISEETYLSGWHISVFDEAHHESCISAQYQLEKLADKPIIGLTATDERADGSLIKFSRIVEPISREDAVARGFLAETELYSYVDAPERDKVEIVKDIIDAHGEEMEKTMVFVRTKKEVMEITEYLRSKGFTAAAALDQSDHELDALLDRFSAAQGKFFIVNCFKIGEGVDVKGCSDLILGRTFGSYPMLNQVIGRAARPDSPCRVREIINPLSGRNLDSTVIVGTPKIHMLYYRINGKWVAEHFDFKNEWNPTQSTLDEQNRGIDQRRVYRR